MSKIVHSVKLIPYDSVDLDRLSYTNGELVYDVTNGTLRLMDGVNQGGTKIASQTYVTNSLAAYATNTSVNTAISTALTGYATTASISSYVTTANLTTTLSGYVQTPLTVAPTNFASQVANQILAGPSSGPAGSVTFRALVAADIPALNYASTGSVALKANIASPTFTGTVTAPTAIIGGVNIKTFAIAMGAALA